jgi:hypothetical protein
VHALTHFCAADWLAVDRLGPINWQTTAFDKLVIPPQRKDLVLSFIQTHTETRSMGTDIVKGKG